MTCFEDALRKINRVISNWMTCDLVSDRYVIWEGCLQDKECDHKEIGFISIEIAESLGIQPINLGDRFVFELVDNSLAKSFPIR